MKNVQIADLLARMADLMEILGQDVFRINSYRKAALVLQELPEPIENISAAGGLLDIPGIGKGMAQKIEQYLATGKIDAYEQLAAKAPPRLIELLHVQGVGPKTIAKLWKEVGIESLDDLRRVLRDSPGKIEALKGMGAKKVQQLQAGLAFVAGTGGRITLGQAEGLSKELLEGIGRSKGVRSAVAAGSLWRGKETIGDIDLLASAGADAAGGIIEAFVTAPAVQRVLAKGDTKGSVVLAGDVQADLRVVAPESFGAALAYFTGSKAHNVRLRELAVKRGWKLNEYGLFDGDKAIAGADEEGIYRKLGLEFVSPELREDRGEVQAAQEGKLPRLLELSDIRGDFHMHTTGRHGLTGSDGTQTIEEMVEACRGRGYKYMCISDHSKSQRQANGLDEARLAKAVAAIHAARKQYPDMLILAGCEVDILKDGTLDFSDDVLAELDFVIASPHAALTMPGPEATRRLIKAIEHPRVHCLGHPSGRLINSRPGMEIDIDAIAKAAAANDVALEVNAHYMRLDLRDTHVRAAIEHGAVICINSDAHSAAELDVMRYGVMTARRGWASKGDVLNAWSVEKLKAWLAKKNRR